MRAHLLLHDFVDSDSVDLGHLVELVDADDAPVGEDHGSGFEAAVARLLVRRDGGSQTDARRSSSSRRNRERSRVQDEPEHLTLGSTRVADHEDVDVASQMRPIREVLLDTAEEEEQHRLLDIV